MGIVNILGSSSLTRLRRPAEATASELIQAWKCLSGNTGVDTGLELSLGELFLLLGFRLGVHPLSVTHFRDLTTRSRGPSIKRKNHDGCIPARLLGARAFPAAGALA